MIFAVVVTLASAVIILLPGATICIAKMEIISFRQYLIGLKRLVSGLLTMMWLLVGGYVGVKISVCCDLVKICMVSHQPILLTARLVVHWWEDH